MHNTCQEYVYYSIAVITNMENKIKLSTFVQDTLRVRDQVALGWCFRTDIALQEIFNN